MSRPTASDQKPSATAARDRDLRVPGRPHRARRGVRPPGRTARSSPACGSGSGQHRQQTGAPRIDTNIQLPISVRGVADAEAAPVTAKIEKDTTLDVQDN